MRVRTARFAVVGPHHTHHSHPSSWLGGRWTTLVGIVLIVVNPTSGCLCVCGCLRVCESVSGVQTRLKHHLIHSLERSPSAQSVVVCACSCRRPKTTSVCVCVVFHNLYIFSGSRVWVASVVSFSVGCRCLLLPVCVGLCGSGRPNPAPEVSGRVFCVCFSPKGVDIVRPNVRGPSLGGEQLHNLSILCPINNRVDSSRKIHTHTHQCVCVPCIVLCSRIHLFNRFFPLQTRRGSLLSLSSSSLS